MNHASCIGVSCVALCISLLFLQLSRLNGLNLITVKADCTKRARSVKFSAAKRQPVLCCCTHLPEWHPHMCPCSCRRAVICLRESLLRSPNIFPLPLHSYCSWFILTVQCVCSNKVEKFVFYWNNMFPSKKVYCIVKCLSPVGVRDHRAVCIPEKRVTFPHHLSVTFSGRLCCAVSRFSQQAKCAGFILSGLTENASQLLQNCAEKQSVLLSGDFGVALPKGIQDHFLCC